MNIENKFKFTYKSLILKEGVHELPILDKTTGLKLQILIRNEYTSINYTNKFSVYLKITSWVKWCTIKSEYDTSNLKCTVFEIPNVFKRLTLERNNLLSLINKLDNEIILSLKIYRNKRVYRSLKNI